MLQLDLNHCSEEWGGTPLKVAASLGHVGIVTSLLRAGAFPLDEHDIQPRSRSARQSARLEAARYVTSPVNKNRRRCAHLVKSIRSSPTIISLAVAHFDAGRSVIAKVSHPQIDLLLGGCEFQIREPKLEQWAWYKVLPFISAEEKGTRHARLGGPVLARPGRRFLFQCRLHSTPLSPHFRSYSTEWSPWSGGDGVLDA